MTREFDPRSKIILVASLSSVAVFFNNIVMLTITLCITFLFSYIMNANIMGVLRKLKGLIKVFVLIAIVQSIFIKSGNPIIAIDKYVIITDTGASLAIMFLLRSINIIGAGSIVATANECDVVEGLNRMKLPYDLCFMVLVAFRFLPVLYSEISDTFTALKLRGINIKKNSLKNKILLISYLFTPVVISCIVKTKKLSLSIETRGFRANDNRTSIIELNMTSADYIVIIFSFVYIGLCIIGWSVL